MIFRSPRAFYRLALAATFLAALGLAACGRKGALDRPPAAASIAVPDETADVAPAPGQPVAPKGSNKRIPLDALLE